MNRSLGRTAAREVVAFVDLAFLLRAGSQVLGTSTVRYDVDLPRLVHWLEVRAGALVHGHFTHAYIYEGPSDHTLDSPDVTIRHPNSHVPAVTTMWSRARTVDAGAEILLAVDIVRMAHEGAYDAAILLAGEADLASAVRLAQDEFARDVVLVSLGGVAVGPALRASADQVVTMSTHEVRLILQPVSSG